MDIPFKVSIPTSTGSKISFWLIRVYQTGRYNNGKIIRFRWEVCGIKARAVVGQAEWAELYCPGPNLPFRPVGTLRTQLRIR